MTTPSTSPSPRWPRLAALTHPVSSLMRFAPSRDIGHYAIGYHLRLAELAFDHDEDGLHRTLLLRRGGLCGVSGAGDSPWRARQKRGQIIAETDDPPLRPLFGAAFRL